MDEVLHIFGPLKLNLWTIFVLMKIVMSMEMSTHLSVLGLAQCAKRLEYFPKEKPGTLGFGHLLPYVTG